MDGSRLLRQDHREAEELFERATADGLDPAVKRAVFEQLSTRLSQHLVAEEELLYPLVRATLPDGDALADLGLTEHHAMKEILARLEHTDIDDVMFDTDLRTVRIAVREHVRTEEGCLLPALAAALGDEKMRTLGDALAAAEQLAPTRPRPNAPNRPPHNVVAAAGAAALDRTLDVAEHRGTVR